MLHSTTPLACKTVQRRCSCSCGLFFYFEPPPLKLSSSRILLDPPMKIDLHTHILPRDWPDLDARYGYPGFVRLDHYKPCCARMMIGDRVFREITDNVWDPKQRLEEMDREKITMQVLSTVPVMFSYWAKPRDALDLSRRLTAPLARVVRDHPRRFAGLATIPLQDPDLAAQESER